VRYWIEQGSKMSNVVKFSKEKRDIPAKAILDVRHSYVEHSRRRIQFLPWNMVLNILIFLIECLQTIVLTLLLWFRPLVFLVCRPLAGLMLIAFIVCLVNPPDNPELKYGFGIFSFSAFLIMHFYDGLLMMLSRGNIVNILN
jgi:hypothetical protein